MSETDTSFCSKNISEDFGTEISDAYDATLLKPLTTKQHVENIPLKVNDVHDTKAFAVKNKNYFNQHTIIKIACSVMQIETHRHGVKMQDILKRV